MIVDWITATGSRWVNATVASGNVAISGPSCSQCCGDFSTHVRGPRRKVNACSTFFMYAVVAGLVEAEVEVPPAGHAGMPFQHVAGEVQVEDLDLLLDRLGEAVVHRRGGGRADHHGVVLVLRPGVPRIDAVDVRALPRNRQWLLAFPVRQRSAARIRGEQVDQMRGARARHSDDDERLLDRDRLDLGVALEQIGQRQPVAQQPHHPLAQRAADQLGQAVVGLDRPDVGRDAIPEPVGRPRSRRRPPRRRLPRPSARCRGRRRGSRCGRGSVAAHRSAGEPSDRRNGALEGSRRHCPSHR